VNHHTYEVDVDRRFDWDGVELFLIVCELKFRYLYHFGEIMMMTVRTVTMMIVRMSAVVGSP
jgi:hypothetical protein